jgi:glutamine cyclotransferase
VRRSASSGLISLVLTVTACGPSVTVSERKLDTPSSTVVDAETGADNSPATEPDTTASSTSTEPAAIPPIAEPPATTVGPQPTTRLFGSYRVEIVAEYAHDAAAYTQGLELHEGRVLESTGRRGESTRRWVDKTSGAVQSTQPLSENLFGEGITIVGDNIFQLTFTSGQLLISNLQDLTQTRTIAYEGEGWGLCFNGEHLVMSNGSDRMTFRDPETFDIVRAVDVTRNGAPVSAINELECVGEQVLANIYGLDQLIVIDQQTGHVDAVVGAGSLRPDGLRADDNNFVLNGIAFDAASNTYLLTGKWWPVLYEVRLVQQ